MALGTARYRAMKVMVSRLVRLPVTSSRACGAVMAGRGRVHRLGPQSRGSERMSANQTQGTQLIGLVAKESADSSQPRRAG